MQRQRVSSARQPEGRAGSASGHARNRPAAPRQGAALSSLGQRTWCSPSSSEREHPSPAGNLGFPVRDAPASDGGAALWHEATVFSAELNAIHSHRGGCTGTWSGLYKAGNDCDASELDFRRPGPLVKALQARCPRIALAVWRVPGAGSRRRRRASAAATAKRRAAALICRGGRFAAARQCLGRASMPPSPARLGARLCQVRKMITKRC